MAGRRDTLRLVEGGGVKGQDTQRRRGDKEAG